MYRLTENTAKMKGETLNQVVQVGLADNWVVKHVAHWAGTV